MNLLSELWPWIKDNLPIFGGMISFFWGVHQFRIIQSAQVETRRIEATRPFLDRQLTLYTDATQAAATLATSNDQEALQKATKRFWSLYWGELALVEDNRVEKAMVKFGHALERESVGKDLQPLSLRLAHACRDSLAESWGVKQWHNPHHPSVNRTCSEQ